MKSEEEIQKLVEKTCPMRSYCSEENFDGTECPCYEYCHPQDGEAQGLKKKIKSWERDCLSRKLAKLDGIECDFSACNVKHLERCEKKRGFIPFQRCRV